MPDLAERPTLAAFQAYVAELEAERGFADQTPVEKCLLLGEEVGELFKAVRRVQGLPVDPTTAIGGVADELADILIFLCSIANRYDVDLEAAFRDKEVINKSRSWTARTAAG
jgi:NTP pyrophosphatase (non-canonical NTP hydrolase)